MTTTKRKPAHGGARKNAGRPALDRTRVVYLRLTDDEHEALMAACAYRELAPRDVLLAGVTSVLRSKRTGDKRVG